MGGKVASGNNNFMSLTFLSSLASVTSIKSFPFIKGINSNVKERGKDDDHKHANGENFNMESLSHIFNVTSVCDDGEAKKLHIYKYCTA